MLYPVCRQMRLSDTCGHHRGRVAGIWHAQECSGDRGDSAARIGDTIRVSLLGDPVPEIDAGFDILRACDRRVTKPEVVACPTCGRLDIDLERIVAEVEEKMKGLSNPFRISILGCLVNGFGEAKEADLGIAAGSGKGIIFKAEYRSATSRKRRWSRPSSRKSRGSARKPSRWRRSSKKRSKSKRSGRCRCLG